MFDKHCRDEIEKAQRELTRLHNRHYARLSNRLKEIKIPQIALDAVAYELSLYTNDVRENILGLEVEKDLFQKTRTGGGK